MLAYMDDTVVGWCALGPRSEMGRLQRSRTIPVVDDRPVWSIVCFVVRAGYRHKGVARALLDGTIGYARDCGVVALESYPVDTNGALPARPRVLVTRRRDCWRASTTT
jgi:GNAT superfamily N-acetyltransferase